MKVQPTTKELIAMLYERLPELFDRAAPVQDEFPLRGILASELKCWHRLTEDEQINLLAFVKNTRPAAQPAAPLTPSQYNVALALVDLRPSQYEAVTRAIEAAHGITEKGQP